MVKKVDLSGFVSGKLTALEPTDKRKDGKVIWRCFCECGNEVYASSTMLKQKRTKSCGCLRKQKSSATGSKTIYKNSKRRGFNEGTMLEAISEKKKINSNNKSGTTGVYVNSKGKWEACLFLQGEVKFKQSFSSKQDAINARKEAEEKYFKPILEKYGKEE